MTIQEATKIAEKFCIKISENRHAVYCGKFNEDLLFSLVFDREGHHGYPLFVIVCNNGEIVYIDDDSEIFDEVWDSSIEYLNSIKRN